MGEMIHVELSPNKRTLSMELSPRQAKDLIEALTHDGRLPPQVAASSLITALFMIKDCR